jgi:F0F1-type ATP synthase assembly protein I
MAKGNDKNRRELVRGLSLFSQIGISVIVCIAIGIFLGRYLDSLLSTSPWLLLLFTLFGAAAAFKSIIDISKRN